MKIIAIAAIDENNGIGYKGELLAHIPEDMKHFKELTTDKLVVMGRKTWDSLGRKPLPDRSNLVITSTPYDWNDEYSDKNLHFMSMSTARAFFDWLKSETGFMPSDVYIIGGASIYEELLPYCDELEITQIYDKYENVDTYFPQIDPKVWKKKNESVLTQGYQFITYERA